eukprot:TRINITY_DN77507_c0_g1_i1.p1 TRINITY_DN77507_c0_g1~~TRINITY_DN77507_c0_g1_i1.p1  ORF type:complete len:253 (+),score=21.77 TRINITY_DN77507_c0_g1_i1:74-832(+)
MRAMFRHSRVMGRRRLSAGCPQDANLDSVAQVVDAKGPWAAVVNFPKRRPFATNMLLCTSLTGLADYQMQMAGGKTFDLKRWACFCAFGVYQGVAQWLVYVSLFARIFPGAIRFANLPLAEKLRNRAGAGQLLGQICADLLVYIPVVYYPVFYVFRGYFHDETPATSLTRYWCNLRVDWMANIAFWGPGDIICFGAPAWMRLPISHLAGFGWNSILSWLRGELTDLPEIPADASAESLESFGCGIRGLQPQV